MSRRVLTFLACLALGALTLAAAPWTLSSGGLAAAVAEHLREEYGLAFAVRGRSSIALLPVPRVKFENVAIADPSGRIAAEGGTLRGQIELWPLLFGRIELSEISLAGSRLALDADALASRAAALRERGPSQTGAVVGLRRLRLMNAALQVRGAAFENVEATADWPGASDPLVITGRFDWRGETVTAPRITLHPSSLVSGAPSPFAAAIETAGSRLSLVGEIKTGEEFRVTGHSLAQAASLRDLSRWAGIDLPLGALVGAASVAGDFTADRRRVSWPAVAITLSADRLDGALALRFDGERPAVTGTLAAEDLDLTEMLGPFAQARTAAGLWSGEEVSLVGAAGGDLDIRLSATRARIGRLRLADVAANVMVRPGRIETALGRAVLNRGALKGRAVFGALEGGGLDVKLQGSFDAVDLGAFLSDLRQPRWITGLAQGQFVIEGAGATPADIVRQSHGRSLLAVRQGELLGFGLGEAMRRLEKRPLSAFLDWRAGRTSFDRAHVALNVGAGLGEITEGTITGPNLHSTLKGRVSLIDRDIAVKAVVDSGGVPEAPLALDVLGSWDDVAVLPDARALIERSGAAKPLVGLDRPTPPRDAMAR